ncbi:hypothetical protein HDV06_005217 [Boothiomyces sp. JEL0866]|nr:hypothetical protein HDV06_005217 [Boothiomyces sp. JEL0866]
MVAKMYRKKNVNDGLYPHEVLSQVSFGSLYSHITVSDSELSSVSLAKQKSFNNLPIPINLPQVDQKSRAIVPSDIFPSRRANRMSLASKSIPNLYARRERDLITKPPNTGTRMRVRKKNSNPKLAAKSQEFRKMSNDIPELRNDMPSFPQRNNFRYQQPVIPIPVMNDLSSFNQRKIEILDMNLKVGQKTEPMQAYPTIRYSDPKKPRPAPHPANINQNRKPSLTVDSESETLGSNSPMTYRKFSFDNQRRAETLHEESDPTEIDYSSDDTEYDEELQRVPSLQPLDVPDIYKQSDIQQTWVAEFLSEFDRLRLQKSQSFSDTDSIVVLSVEKSLKTALSKESFVYNQSVLVYPPKKAIQSYTLMDKEKSRSNSAKPLKLEQQKPVPAKTNSQPLPAKKSETLIQYLPNQNIVNQNESAELIGQKVTYSLDKNQIISRSNTIGKTTNKSKFAIDKPLPIVQPKKKVEKQLSVIVTDGKRVSVLVTPGREDEKKLNFFKRIMGKKNAKSSPHKLKLLV